MDDVLIIKKVVKDGKPPHSGTYRAIFPDRISSARLS